MREYPAIVRLADESETVELAVRFSQHIRPPLVLFLRGDLGTGKTTFARALIQALGYDGRVKSPTFGLLETYTVSGLEILHLDLYRIAQARELEFLAIRDLLVGNSLLLVEWPERGESALPKPDLVLSLDHEGAGRIASLNAPSDAGKALAEAVLRGVQEATSS